VRRAILYLVAAAFVSILISKNGQEGPSRGGESTSFGADQTQQVEKTASSQAEGEAARMWVVVDRLRRRTCPSTNCGIVRVYFFREAVDVFERKDTWVRVTKYYDAWCVNGRSRYVDSGNASCSSENGISNGQFAEWVDSRYLNRTEPPDPAVGAVGLHKLVAASDDYRIYSGAFAAAAEKLIANSTCTEADFKEMGGFVKSTSKKGSVYFIYCGGFTVANRIYLDAKTGRTFR
jgi:hypothetical protein